MSTPPSAPRAIEVVNPHGFPLDALHAAIAAQGLHSLPATLVLVASPFDPSLPSWNRDAIAQRRPWLLAKPCGREPWVGPLFLPAHNACWACLRHRLVENQWWNHAAWLAGEPVSIDAEPLDPATLHSLWLYLVTQLRLWRDGGESELDGAIVSVHPQTWMARHHFVTRRPQCPLCGDLGRPRLWAANPPPEPFLQRLERHYSPLTGFLSGLREATDERWRPAHLVSALCTLPLDNRNPFAGQPPEIVVGRGLTVEQAALRCLAEGVERYSAIFQGDEPVRRAKVAELGEAAVHPSRLLQFRSRQFAETNPPIPFDPAQPIDWVEARSLTHPGQETRFLPAAYVYLRHGQPSHPFCFADSNGCACGEDVDSAALRGLLELIERDAAAIWRHNRAPRPTLDESLAGPFAEPLRRHGLALELFDLTTAWLTPVVAAVSTDSQGVQRLGCAAALTLAEAAQSAASELIQSLLSSDTPETLPSDNSLPEPLTATPCTPEAPPFNLAQLLDRARHLGIEIYTVDLTRPETAIPVLRVVAPGLRSHLELKADS